MTHWRLSYSNYKIKAPCLLNVDDVCVCDRLLHSSQKEIIGHQALYIFVCLVFLQEECILSDPQGESDADADIEDTDCRFGVHTLTFTRTQSL